MRIVHERLTWYCTVKAVTELLLGNHGPTNDNLGATPLSAQDILTSKGTNLDTQLEPFLRRSTHKRECNSISGSVPRRCPTQKKSSSFSPLRSERYISPSPMPSGTFEVQARNADISSIARVRKLHVRVKQRDHSPQAAD